MEVMKQQLLRTKFENCLKLLQLHTQRISEKFGRLRSAAALVVEESGNPPTLENYINGIPYLT